MQVWIPAVLSFLGAIVTGAMGAWALTRKARFEASSAKATAEAAVQTVINDGFHKLTEQLQEELRHAKTEAAKLREDMADLQGWIRDLIQHIESLERNLSENGLDVPERNFPHPLLARKTN